MSMKAPFIVNEAKEALESGNSVVIGLQTTGEVRIILVMLKYIKNFCDPTSDNCELHLNIRLISPPPQLTFHTHTQLRPSGCEKL